MYTLLLKVAHCQLSAEIAAEFVMSDSVARPEYTLLSPNDMNSDTPVLFTNSCSPLRLTAVLAVVLSIQPSLDPNRPDLSMTQFVASKA